MKPFSLKFKSNHNVHVALVELGLICKDANEISEFLEVGLFLK